MYTRTTNHDRHVCPDERGPAIPQLGASVQGLDFEELYENLFVVRPATRGRVALGPSVPFVPSSLCPCVIELSSWFHLRRVE